MVDLQELGRPLRESPRGVPEKKSPAGLQLTRHLEYDILQCIAKDRPEVSRGTTCASWKYAYSLMTVRTSM